MKDLSDYPLIDAIDHEILMHRDAHFGGQFSIMLTYYREEGKGVQPEFSLERIEKLEVLEGSLQQNLSALLLDAQEMERVAAARAAYKSLRAIYEVEQSKTLIPRLVADLILSEEEEPLAELEALAAQKEKGVPALLDILRNEELYDALFPGYGSAPSLAVRVLEKIGDKRALIGLFEALGSGDFFADDYIVKALHAIGAPAKEFLLKVVKGRPLNEDNERAAIALIAFKEDEEVAKSCLSLLSEADVQADPCLPTYLVLACAGLKGEEHRRQFKEISQSSAFPKLLREDVKSIVKEWDS